MAIQFVCAAVIEKRNELLVKHYNIIRHLRKTGKGKKVFIAHDANLAFLTEEIA